MAQPSNLQATNDTVGNREDLVDFIYDISPVETPILSALPRVKARAVTHEWQTDALAAAATNYTIEGDDATVNAVTASVRLNNVSQILDKVAAVSGTQLAVVSAGRDDEMAYQMMKRMKELKRDLEFAISDNNAKVTGNDTLAREMAGFPAYAAITGSASKASDGTYAAGTGADAYTPGTARVFTEDLLAEALQNAYTNGGDPKIGVLGPFNKRKVSGFAGNATRLDKSEDKKLVASVDVYVGDFHTIEFRPSRFCEADSVYLIDPEFAAVAYLRDFHTQDLAVDGDYEKKAIRVEATLEVRNQKAHTMVLDLTTS